MTLDSRCANAHRGAGDRTARRQAADVAQPALHAADAQQPLVAETLHQISQRLFVRSKHASRRVEETDEVLAKHIIQDADNPSSSTVKLVP